MLVPVSGPPAPARQDSPAPAPMAPARADAPLVARVTAARETLSVEFFHDQVAGHYVYRLEDPVTGQTLLQIPGDDLMRFFASLREELGRAPVVVA